MGKNKGGAFFFGALLGGIFSLLFAPKKGKELRKDLQKSYKEKGWEGNLAVLKKESKVMMDDVSKTAQEIKESPRVKKAVNKGKKQAKTYSKIAEKRLEELESNAKEKVDEVIDEIKAEGKKQVKKVQKKTKSKKRA